MRPSFAALSRLAQKECACLDLCRHLRVRRSLDQLSAHKYHEICIKLEKFEVPPWKLVFAERARGEMARPTGLSHAQGPQGLFRGSPRHSSALLGTPRHSSTLLSTPHYAGTGGFHNFPCPPVLHRGMSLSVGNILRRGSLARFGGVCM